MKIIITFYTTYDSLKAEEVLKEAGLKINVRPIPREISSDCGLGIGGDFVDKGRIIEVLNKSQVEYDNIYELDK